MPKIIKYVNGEDAALKGAFSFGTKIDFHVEIPRKLGVAAVVLRVCTDGMEHRDEDSRVFTEKSSSGERYFDCPLSFESSYCGKDSYLGTLDTSFICIGREYGLFFYELLFLRGEDTLFTDSVNNVDFNIGTRSGRRFELLVYKSQFDTPEWFGGASMYHIFVDRFFRGEGEVFKRDDSKLNEDWENGIPQYPDRAGDPVTNNVFFGGNLWGVADKLDYLQSLGINVIYLSPIFAAYSNHRYDTADYSRVDGLLGGDEALKKLIAETKKRNMHIILDGVFNHTGDDSLYFDRYGKFGGQGAYCSQESPYYNWYNFSSWPDKYESWWGIEIMPKLNLHNCDCRDYLVGEGGIIEKYTDIGIDGWRLDVADELTDDFLDSIRKTSRKTARSRDEKPCDALVIGEVWENAANKIAYGKRRRYFCGDQLDSVMNYPVKNAIISFVRDRDAHSLYNTLTEIYSSYPSCVCNALMNILGTHDTERILTVLGTEDVSDFGRPNPVLAASRLNYDKRQEAVRLLKMASVIQSTVFGVPSLFYGDEAGLEGFHDPFCRMPYPWGREDSDLVAHYTKLGSIRRDCSAFDGGDFRIIDHSDKFIAYERRKGSKTVVVAVNRSDETRELTVSGNMRDMYNEKESPEYVICVKECALDNHGSKEINISKIAVKPNSFIILEGF